MFIYFNSLPAQLDVGINPDTGEQEGLVRRALLFVEGDHTDSNQRGHQFPEDRVHKLVRNTNAWFESGGFIPLLLDHNKSATAVVGSLDAPLEMKVLTEQDIAPLPNANRLGHLVGRLGVFCNAVSLKAQEAIDCFQKNWVKSVSPGIDLATDTIRELSLVATPAIAGLSLFSAAERGLTHFAAFSETTSGDAKEVATLKRKYEMPRTTALSLSDALAQQKVLSDKREEYDELCEMLWQVLENIYDATPEVLGDMPQEQLLEESIQEFGDQLYQLLEINLESRGQTGGYDSYNGEYADQFRARDEQLGYGSSGQYDPAYLKRQQELDPYAQYSSPNYSIFIDEHGYARKPFFRLHDVLRG